MEVKITNDVLQGSYIYNSSNFIDDAVAGSGDSIVTTSTQHLPKTGGDLYGDLTTLQLSTNILSIKDTNHSLEIEGGNSLVIDLNQAGSGLRIKPNNAQNQEKSYRLYRSYFDMVDRPIKNAFNLLPRAFCRLTGHLEGSTAYYKPVISSGMFFYPSPSFTLAAVVNRIGTGMFALDVDCAKSGFNTELYTLNMDSIAVQCRGNHGSSLSNVLFVSEYGNREYIAAGADIDKDASNPNIIRFKFMTQRVGLTTLNDYSIATDCMLEFLFTGTVNPGIVSRNRS